ncbi:unnamed protein product [Auanema sp. JU1783]|nr:unnamed protein product [Auanema sp. JU1783]
MKYFLLFLLAFPLVFTYPVEYVIKKKDFHLNICRAFVRQWDNQTMLTTDCFEYDTKLYTLNSVGDCMSDIHQGPGHLPRDRTIPMNRCSSNSALTNYANARWKTIITAAG